jgi:hypothetical protein
MPGPSHVWKQLVLREGKVYHTVPGKSEAEYMVTPPIEIIRKRGATPEREDPRVVFEFELNQAPDSAWQRLLAANLSDVPPGIIRPEFSVTIIDRLLRLVCLASHLERIYPFVKSAIAETNSDYEAEKQAVLQHVMDAEAHKTRPGEEQQTKADIAREKFTQLEL